MSKLKESIIEQLRKSFAAGEIDEKGYLRAEKAEREEDAKKNLLDGLKNDWAEIRTAFLNGAGNELAKDSNGRAKFCALHSSSALCVNAFAPFMREEFSSFLSWRIEGKPYFEAKKPTGIPRATANLDFYFETDNEIIGIESKFTEYLSKTNFPEKWKSWSKYSEEKVIDTEVWDKLIEPCMKGNHYLNAPQLIKHAIGLMNNCPKNKTITLLYIYWTPKDVSKNSNYHRLYEQHRAEIKEFSKVIKEFIKFEAMSYNDFWEKMKKQCPKNDVLDKHIVPFKERYDFDI